MFEASGRGYEKRREDDIKRGGCKRIKEKTWQEAERHNSANTSANLYDDDENRSIKAIINTKTVYQMQ